MSSAVKTRAAVSHPAGHVMERTIVETAQMNPKRSAMREHVSHTNSAVKTTAACRAAGSVTMTMTVAITQMRRSACHVSALKVSLPALTAVVLLGGGSVMEIMTVQMDLMSMAVI